ncbi:uncharacterized protein LAESUDRAFT_764680 [Laetiporus sulphureus 93-53]|uniref:F-box domain-containing protein n=1 Tax=Laetiporus sulphureus 93-53 TaxID=1314785 RepID=A0A165B770_9APHY|nr:uncharacterized protein LAESUDRAFT_764680 [Laetiporus sulphureus 93-53]KZT00403.1 hypothetical protein LAESUDRAFT_764680 [Laetiporus sulphureus 93-53]
MGRKFKSNKVLRRLARMFKRKRHHSKLNGPDDCTQLQAGPSFPLEIFELIIDFVWPDRQALFACSLTCKAWLHRSRHNLFYSIQLRRQEHLTQLSSMVEAEPRLGRIVRELFVVPYHMQSQLFGSFPFTLGGQLPNVNRLRIDIRRDYYPYVHPDFFCAFSRFSSITTLEIHRIQFPTFGDYVMLVCALPRLTSLSCWMVDWLKKTYDPALLKEHDGRLPLNHLSMRQMNWSAELADFLLAIASIADLQSLSTYFLGSQEVEHVNRLLETAGSSLRRFAIGLPPSSGLRSQNKLISPWDGHLPRLVHNTRLSTLQLDFDGGNDWASEFLPSISSSLISDVTVRWPPLPKPLKLKHYHCDKIDIALCLPQFKKLERVVFQVVGNFDIAFASACRVEILSRFPLLAARNIVEVEIVTADDS